MGFAGLWNASRPSTGSVRWEASDTTSSAQLTALQIQRIMVTRKNTGIVKKRHVEPNQEPNSGARSHAKISTTKFEHAEKKCAMERPRTCQSSPPFPKKDTAQKWTR